MASPGEKAAASDRASAADLERHLEHLPGVADASVVVTRPASDPFAASAPRPAAAASIILATHGDLPALRARASSLAAAALPDLDPGRITIDIAPLTPPPPELRRVGPFVVTAASRPALLATLVAALAAVVLLGGFTVARELKRRRDYARRGIKVQ